MLDELKKFSVDKKKTIMLGPTRPLSRSTHMIAHARARIKSILNTPLFFHSKSVN